MTDSDRVISDYLGFGLPGEDQLAQARRAALLRGLEGSTEPTSLVSYTSAGLVLIIGPEPSALLAAESLVGSVACFVLLTDTIDNMSFRSAGYEKRQVAGQDVPVISGKPKKILGHLGNFEVIIERGQREVELAKVMNLAGGGIDIVLDLARVPLLRTELLPPGYFAPAGNSSRLDQALSDIPDLTGTFEKPGYVQYNPDICAHGERGIAGCTQCLDACPSGSLTSLAERIAVDPYLCHGMGSCSAVCPTGAMTYAYPNLARTLDSLRRLLRCFREATDKAAALLLFDSEYAGSAVEDAVGNMAADIIPWRIEETGSTGIEIWLSALAYGARSVMIVTTTHTPLSTLAALESQVKLANVLLDGLGYSSACVRLIDVEHLYESGNLASGPSSGVTAAATYGGFDEKRIVLRFALDHLIQTANVSRDVVDLPNGSPFGAVVVDTDACTLCMGCVSVCPSGAMGDDKERPRLTFLEWNCVQCGICERACPEDAISLNARLLLNAEKRMRARTVNEESPFHCIDCGKPFGTQSMVAKMEEKLKGHRMFQGARLKSLQRCEDCRIKAMF